MNSGTQVSASLQQSAASGAHAYGTQRGTFFGSGIKARGSGVSFATISTIAAIIAVLWVWKKK